MKKSIYLTFVFIGLLLSVTGCGNKQAKSGTDDQAYRDSIAAAKAAEEAAQRVADSLSFNVWGDVKFGMTIEEVSKTGAFGTLKGSEEWYEIDGKVINKSLGTKAIRKSTILPRSLSASSSTLWTTCPKVAFQKWKPTSTSLHQKSKLDGRPSSSTRTRASPATSSRLAKASSC